jgi:predicted DsbA family dithiol-disulfide isomerase
LENTKTAVKQLSLGEEVKQMDVKDAAKFGVTLFPAIIVDGKVITEGKTRTVDELVGLIRSA